MLKGLIVFVVLAVFLLAQGPMAYENVRSWMASSPDTSDAVTAPKRADELATKGLREQLITFADGLYAQDRTWPAFEINRTATPSDLFIIPVGQLSLSEPESVSRYANRAQQG